MKRFRIAVAAVLALLWTGMPLAACLLPGYAMSAEEQECCRSMAGACEGQQSAHSCCKSVVRPAQAAMTAKALNAAKPAIDPLFLAALHPLFTPESVAGSQQWFSHNHSPPGAAEPLITFLRI